MENFLQKISSKQNPSQSNYEQQNILQQLEVMQQENFKLLRNVQELEGKIAYLMFNSITVKNENSQPFNLRIEQIETKFNQLAELTESLFLKNISTNDPIDMKPNIQSTKIPIVKKLKRCWYCKKHGNFLGQCEKFQQKQELENLKLWRSTSKLYCTPEGLIYRKKMYAESEILRDIAFVQQRRNCQMLGFELD